MVKTKNDSLHRGKVYFLRSKTPENAKLWMETAVTASVSFFDAPMVVGNVPLFTLFLNDFLLLKTSKLKKQS